MAQPFAQVCSSTQVSAAAPAPNRPRRSPTARRTCGLLALVLLAACGGADKPAETAEPVVVTPAIRVAEGEKLLFRYFSGATKAPSTAESIDKVPADAREMVIVIPEDAVVPAGHVLVADLRKAGADGTYPYRLLAQSALDAELAKTRVVAADAAPGTPAGQGAGQRAVQGAPGKAPAGPAAAPGKNDIVMFSASWCGVCKQARRWFRNKGIEVVERDVEEDPKAQGDMADYARRAGVDPRSLTGVPVIWVNGQLFPGFDPGRISAALR